MPVTWKINTDYELLYVRYLGVVKTEEIWQAYNSYLADPMAQPDHFLLIDLTGCSLQGIDFNGVSYLARQLQDIYDFRGPEAKSVAICPEGDLFATARMYLAASNQYTRRTLHLYTTMTEALDRLLPHVDQTLLDWLAQQDYRTKRTT